MSAQDIFGIVAILYCVANLGSMGLELNLHETMKALSSPRLVTLNPCVELDYRAITGHFNH